MTLSLPDKNTLDLFKMFLDTVITEYQRPLHSVHMTGSVLTTDFKTGRSDINSVFVLNEMDLQFLSVLAPLGKRFGKKGIAAPLIMTPDYIRRSLDVFPIEFLNLKLIHHTVLGEDIIKDLAIKRTELRWQCERELKVRLIGLRQTYIRAAEHRNVLSKNIITSISASIPLFRALIFLLGKKPPINSDEVLTILQAMVPIDIEAFQNILRCKKERRRLPLPELNVLFQSCYTATEKLGDLVDAIKE